MSEERNPKALITPGVGGTITEREWIRRPSAFACIGPAPPKATRACLTGRCVRVIPCRKATTTGETRRDGQTRRDHRSGLARDRTPLARIRPKRGPMEGPPHRHKRHPLEAQDRLALA